MITKLKKTTLGWITSLCFLSGMINTISILLYANSITHITGRATQILVELSLEKTMGLLKSIEIMFLFLVGNAISGYILADSSDEDRRNLRCGKIIIFIGTALTISYISFFKNGGFIFSLPILIGMQNGMLIKYEGMATKTTHITGTFTDIGVYIGKYIKGDKSEIWKLKFSISTLSGFFIGGFFSIKIYWLMGKNVFIFIGLSYVILGLLFLKSTLKKIKSGKESQV